LAARQVFNQPLCTRPGDYWHYDKSAFHVAFQYLWHLIVLNGCPGEEVGADQEDGNLAFRKSVVNLLSPVAADRNLSVVPNFKET
jgi:hypothetical protein